MVSRDVIFDEKSILERAKNRDEGAAIKLSSSDSSSQGEDRPSTSSEKSITVEVELGRKDLLEMKDRKEKSAIQSMEVQEQSQQEVLQETTRGVAFA